MIAVHLRRVDPANNMHRFYRLDVQPDLFGGVIRGGARFNETCKAGRDSDSLGVLKTQQPP